MSSLASHNPTRSQLAQVIANRSNTRSADVFSKELAAYLLATARTSELAVILRDVVALKTKLGVVEVTAICVRQLPSESVDEIETIVKELYPNAKQIIIDQKIDERQIGGVRLELPGKQLDLSIRHKLNQFKQLTKDK